MCNAVGHDSTYAPDCELEQGLGSSGQIVEPQTAGLSGCPVPEHPLCYLCRVVGVLAPPGALRPRGTDRRRLVKVCRGWMKPGPSLLLCVGLPMCSACHGGPQKGRRVQGLCLPVSRQFTAADRVPPAGLEVSQDALQLGVPRIFLGHAGWLAGWCRVSGSQQDGEG